MDFPNIGSLPGFLIALVLGPICALAVIGVTKYMLDGELDLGPGIVAILCTFTVLALTIMSKSQVLAGIVIVAMLTIIAFFPYAVEHVALAEMRGMDIDHLDRAYKEIIARPGNIASYFALAELVHSLGLKGHAVAIAERTLASLSTEIDPVKNQSLRGVFRTEESRTKQWRRQILDQAEFHPVACPRCGHKNEPGTIACGGCQGPFLLDIARRIDPRKRIRSRLAAGFALIAGLIAISAYTGLEVEGALKWVVLGVALAVAAGTLTWLYRPRAMGRK